jgi:RNA polymerase sigma-B factor
VSSAYLKTRPPDHAPAASGADATRRDEVDALFARCRQGDLAARQALIERFLPLAHRLARRYARFPDSMDDLGQVASLALVKAVDRFSPERGVTFTTFAVPTILGELKRHFRDTGWGVHVPRSLQESSMRVERADRELAAELGRSPTVAEVARRLDMSTEDALTAMQVRRMSDPLSLDAPRAAGPEGEQSYADFLGAEDETLELVVYEATLAAGIRQLPAADRRILHMRFSEDLTQSEIAARVGVSQMQVSRILRRSIERLRELAESPPSVADAA